MVVKRSHTSDNVAPAVRALRNQVNRAFPLRLQTSAGTDADGIWPSKAHTAANPNSDHEAGNALDIDDDLSGVDGKEPSATKEFARRLSLHPACNYTIHDATFFRDGVGTPYSGSNPHTGHVHVSVYESKRSDTSPWDIGGTEAPVEAAHWRGVLFTGDIAVRDGFIQHCKDLGWSAPLPVSRYVIVHVKDTRIREWTAAVKRYGGVEQFALPDGDWHGSRAPEIVSLDAIAGGDGSTVAPRLERAKDIGAEVAALARQAEALAKEIGTKGATIGAL